MTAKKERSGAASATGEELLAVTDAAKYDELLKELIRVRESAHDRERQATAAEAQLEGSRRALQDAREALDRDITQTRKELDAREAACAEREAALEPREARIAKFNKMIKAA